MRYRCAGFPLILMGQPYHYRLFLLAFLLSLPPLFYPAQARTEYLIEFSQGPTADSLVLKELQNDALISKKLSIVPERVPVKGLGTTSFLKPGMPLPGYAPPPLPRKLLRHQGDTIFEGTDTVIRLESSIFGYLPAKDTVTPTHRWALGTTSIDAVYTPIDSSFWKAHRIYEPLLNHEPYQSLGISFGPVQALSYFARPTPYDAILFSHMHMQPYLQHHHALYNSVGPLSIFEATYNFRTTQAELWGSWRFTQNINPYWNIAFEAFHGDETASITNLTTRLNGGQLSGWYARKGWFISASAGYRKSRFKDNGGVSHPFWITDTVLKLDVVPIRLEKARVSDRAINARLDVEYPLAYHQYRWVDSLKKGYRYSEPALSIFASQTFQQLAHSYTNEALNDSLEVDWRPPIPHTFSRKWTYDSVTISRYEAFAGVNYRPSRAPGLRWLPTMSACVGYRLEYISMPHPLIYLTGWKPNSEQNLSVGAKLKHALGPIDLQGSALIFLIGNEQGHTRIRGEVGYRPFPDSDKLKINAFVEWQSRPLPRPLTHYIGNEYHWDIRPTSFIHHLDARATLNAPWWGGTYGAQMRLYKNFVYFNEHGVPARSNIQNVTQVFVGESLYRWGLSLEVKLYLQWASDARTLHLPLLAGYALMGYEYPLVPNALTARLAVEATYHTPYPADVYNSAAGVFHLQNDFTVGNYPFINALLSLKWKSVNVFLSVIHLNQGWTGKQRFASTLYPHRPRSFRLGLEWYFH